MIKISLIGKSNVGKSTLFNLISTTAKAIVHHKSGVTRNIKYGYGNIESINFIIIDTPSYQATNIALNKRIEQQITLAIDESDIILFIGDKEISNEDFSLVNLIRKKDKKYIFLINKCEKQTFITQEHYKLGFGTPILISAAYNIGISEIFNKLKPIITCLKRGIQNHENINISIIGKPNSGKSTLINSILKKDLLITGKESGLTREDIPILFQYRNYNVKIVDTAGLRSKNKVIDELEKLSNKTTVNALRNADVVVLLIDVINGLSNQDIKIANLVLNQGIGLIIGVNKIDILKQKINEFKKNIQYKISICLSQVKEIPVIYLSALQHIHVNNIIETCCTIHTLLNAKISTPKLNTWVKEISSNKSLKKNEKILKLKYCCQVSTNPFIIKLFVNNTELLTNNYKRYLLNNFRSHFNLLGLPIILKIASTNSKNI